MPRALLKLTGCLLGAALLSPACKGRHDEWAKVCTSQAETPPHEVPEEARKACNDVCGNAHHSFSKRDSVEACRLLARWDPKHPSHPKARAPR